MLNSSLDHQKLRYLGLKDTKVSKSMRMSVPVF